MSSQLIFPDIGRLSKSVFPRRQFKEFHDFWSLTHREFERMTCTWTITGFNSYKRSIPGLTLTSSQFETESGAKIRFLLSYIDDQVAMKPLFSATTRAKFRLSIIKANGEEAKVLDIDEYQYSYSHEHAPWVLSKKDILFDENNALLPDNNLTIYCQIYIAKETKTCSGKVNTFNWNLSTRELSDDLKDTLKHERFSDVTILVKEREFKAHKVILGSRSPVFRSMFSNDMEENISNRVELADVEPDVFEKLLEYIYTDETSLESNLSDDEVAYSSDEEHLAIELLKAADKYQLDGLKRICEKAIYHTFSIDSVAAKLSLADLYNAPKLRAKAIEFIIIHASKVIKTDTWIRLIEQRPDFAAEMFTEQIAFNEAMAAELK